MSRLHIFGDEAGDFNFADVAGASKYFMIVTVTLDDDEAVSHALLRLRRELVWDSVDFSGAFHAHNDPMKIRLRVLETLAKHDFRVDATLLNKGRTNEQLRETNLRFYKTAWFLHLKYVLPHIADPEDELLVVAATITTDMKKMP